MDIDNLTNVLAAIYNLQKHNKKKYLIETINDEGIKMLHVDINALPEELSDMYFLYLLYPYKIWLGPEIIEIIREMLSYDNKDSKLNDLLKTSLN
jgi:hypothetical protein